MRSVSSSTSASAGGRSWSGLGILSRLAAAAVRGTPSTTFRSGLVAGSSPVARPMPIQAATPRTR
eukprot:8208296-Alexandrium_andersonii.AAC.1